MPEFFLELFSEEIPARMQVDAAQELLYVCQNALKDLGDVHPLHLSAGSRRLAFAATVLSEKPSGLTEQRGPRDSAPDAAINGFLRKHNARLEELVVENGHYLLRRNAEPIAAAIVIKDVLPDALKSFSWSKSMRWESDEDFSWVRPLRRIICLLDGEVVPIVLGTVTASNVTEGHRSFGNDTITVSSWRDWEKKLYDKKVKADQAFRRRDLLVGLNAKADDTGLSLVDNAELIDEVNGLVEWPVPLIGKIDENFMSLPPEVRELSMKVNQKYFALRDTAGKPAPYFAFVANLDAADGGAAIIAGNERVLRARLADARHFWDRDLLYPLDTLLPKLDGIVFHIKIGTQLARAERISKLARVIAETLGATGFEAVQAEWAGRLCKADLVTGMVGEFPELQGVMGGYYAERSMRGWDGDVVGPAIKTHYQPKGPTDAVPSGIVSVSVALADKIDTLVEFFRIGETPTGSGDPYALRRAALGVIRIILENELTLPLKPLLDKNDDLFNFIIQRFRIALRSEGRRFDVLDAVLAVGDDDDLLRLQAKVSVLSARLNTEDGINLLVGYRRAANILRAEEAKDGRISGDPDPSLFNELEADLSKSLSGLPVYTYLISDLEHGLMTFADFAGAVGMLAQLRAPVDAFFDKVTVNTLEPELRLNRLRLLAQLRDTMHQIADFSKIEG